MSSSVDGVVTNYLVDKNRDYAKVLEERDAGAGLIANYVYGDDLIIMDRSGIVSFYHYDGNGNTRQLTDIGENITDSYTYDAVGIMLYQTGITVNNYLYTGEQYDANVGFYYLRARYYSPNIGRFITVDPWEGKIWDPRSLHKYLYTGNDPINRIDPSGKFFSIVSMSIVTSIASVLIGIYAGYVIGATTYIFSQLPVIAGRQAIPYAELLTSFAISSLGNTQLYEEWFGITTPARKNHVTSGYMAIYNALNSNITFHFTPLNVYAYVYPGGPLEIWLGRLFLSAPMTGIDSRAGTLIHELSHEVHGTADFVYGYNNAKNLAIISPNDAVNNADNYEYFAEIQF